MSKRRSRKVDRFLPHGQSPNQGVRAEVSRGPECHAEGSQLLGPPGPYRPAGKVKKGVSFHQPALSLDSFRVRLCW